MRCAPERSGRGAHRTALLRRPAFVLFSLSILLALLALRVCWSPPAQRGEERASAPPPADHERAELPALTGTRLQGVPLKTRQPVEPASTEPVLVAAASPTPSLVRVTGQIRRAGRALAGCELTFRTLQREQGAQGFTDWGFTDWDFTDWGFTDWDFTDWDFTDEDGRYEVELPAARYVVRSEDGGLLAEVLVPDGRQSFDLDLDLRRDPRSPEMK